MITAEYHLAIGVRLETSDPELAISHYLAATKSPDERSLALYRLGRLYLELGQYRKAVTSMRKSLELTPGHNVTIALLAKALIGARQYRRALHFIFAEWEQMHPTAQHSGLVVAAHVLARAPNIDRITAEVWASCSKGLRSAAVSASKPLFDKVKSFDPNVERTVAVDLARKAVRIELRLK